MKKALLIIRLPIETAFGLLYMSGLLLLPKIWRDTFPQTLVVGYLGMPRYPNSSAQLHFNAIAALVGLLFIAFLVANGLLWFKDVRDIIQKFRTKPQNS